MYCIPQFSDILLHTKPSGTGTFEFKDEMPIFGMRVSEFVKISLHYYYTCML